ncbi:MAG TPA: hypothetical protein VGK66_03810 [Solirubrobacterales bacterium]|nr:hypothetical protein [Solirubrobacterales bacterium]
MRGPRAVFCFAVAIVAALAIGVAPAAATFHLMQIREVYPGSAAAPEAEYVELQMWASGQNLVEGHILRSYDAAGNVNGSSTFTHDVSGNANQSTLLLATPQAEAQFGVAADASLAAGSLSPSGGAVCWETIDCVSWGSFSGALPSPAGTPAAPGGIPDGMALRRSISRGCATLLEPVDDNDDSAEDFALGSPLPRPNSVPPTEQPCTPGGTGGGSGDGTAGGGGGGGGGTAGGPGQSTGLDTFLRHKPQRRSHDRTPTFRFTASDNGASFECKLDGKPYRNCRSPFPTRRLHPGKHHFLVRARSGGEVDPSPASWRFRVLRAG